MNAVLRVICCLFAVFYLVVPRRYLSAWDPSMVFMYYLYLLIYLVLSVRRYAIVNKSRALTGFVALFVTIPFFVLLFEITRSRYVPQSGVELLGVVMLVLLSLLLPVVIWRERERYGNKQSRARVASL